MTYMYEVMVKRDYIGNGLRLPAGLSVRVPHDQMSSPLYSTAGKQRIAQAFATQCGVDLSRCPSAISTTYMEANRM